MRTIILRAALACAAPETAATAQGRRRARPTARDLVTIRRLRDEFAGRPDEAIDSRLHGPPHPALANFERPVVLPEPFRSRTFAAESYVLLDVDNAGRDAGRRPLRAGAHPEFDAFACTLLMRPGYFVASVYSPAVQPRARLAGRWVMGLRWESLTAAARRQRESSSYGHRIRRGHGG